MHPGAKLFRALVTLLFVLLLGSGCKTTAPVVDTGPELSDVETFDPSAYEDEEPSFEGDIRHEIPERLLDSTARSTETEAVSRNVPGFRIQVASFRERAAANQAFQQALSWTQESDDEETEPVEEKHEVYLQWDQPYWKVRLGDFVTRKAAESVIEEVRNTFQGAFIVPAIVTIQ